MRLLSQTTGGRIAVRANAALGVRRLFGEAINREPVAEQVVGSIGLIAAVPLTTAVAALLAVRMPSDELSVHGHAHRASPMPMHRPLLSMLADVELTRGGRT